MQGPHAGDICKHGAGRGSREGPEGRGASAAPGPQGHGPSGRRGLCRRGSGLPESMPPLVLGTCRVLSELGGAWGTSLQGQNPLGVPGALWARPGNPAPTPPPPFLGKLEPPGATGQARPTGKLLDLNSEPFCRAPWAASSVGSASASVVLTGLTPMWPWPLSDSLKKGAGAPKERPERPASNCYRLVQGPPTGEGHPQEGKK